MERIPSEGPPDTSQQLAKPKPRVLHYHVAGIIHKPAMIDTLSTWPHSSAGPFKDVKLVDDHPGSTPNENSNPAWTQASQATDSSTKHTMASN